MTSLLVIYAHPSPARSRVHELLREHIPPAVTVHDLYRRYPDFDVDVDHEQQALAAATHVVLQFPLQWYSVPPLLKAWLDDVLLLGWAYGEGGQALRGKTLTVVTSAGGPLAAYEPTGSNRYSLEVFLRPLEQTAHLCGMHWQAPHVLYAADRASQAEIMAYATHYQTWLNQRITAE
ncbi:NAD(P)H-dependent oxidoreductase [Parvibium lacunae]|uniref:NAD(P)H dehydrogenase n=1 Tax=Parvibium lacunae TaxID=1888893 RepID=A0A368KYH0_9BURK|nr:NAD(P)H-dependent oxidoreductase [Parvibium lacunae]RCS56485.1 NAD(P)H dehydrogenase [Parvibium lacunae]